MKALLLAAGFGTRLRPLTDHIPKCLVPIQNKPLLERWLELLFSHEINSQFYNAATELCTSERENKKEFDDKQNQINQVLINTHYLSHVVEDFISTSPFKNAITLVHEPELLGTAGTVLKNRDFFGNESFLLAHADNLTRFNVDAFIGEHYKRKPGVAITMMTFDTDIPESCGIVEVDQDNVVIDFHEKSKMFHGNRANAAVYIIDPSVIDFLDSLGKEIIDFSTEVLPHYLGRIQVYHNADYHRDIGTPKSLEMAEIEF